MRLSTKKLALALVAMTMLSTPALANDMINNTATGYVGGDLLQENPTRGELTVDVGSIVATNARDNTAEGFVEGGIRQDARYGIDNDLNVQVGSIKADFASDNRATGLVRGSITQSVANTDADLEARVGSVEAVDGLAWGNTAHGVVEGNLFQYTTGGDVKARIGSISSK